MEPSSSRIPFVYCGQYEDTCQTKHVNFKTGFLTGRALVGRIIT